MDAEDIKRIVARYLRYDCGCPILALECPSSLASSFNNGGAADLLAVNKQGRLIEVEVKISLADMKADKRKGKHEYYRKVMGMPYKNTQIRFGQKVTIEPQSYPTHQFYFAVPFDLGNDAKTLCENMYPYAGLLVQGNYYYGSISVERKATILSKEKIGLLEATKLAKAQSGTLVRLLEELAFYKKKQNNDT